MRSSRFGEIENALLSSPFRWLIVSAILFAIQAVIFKDGGRSFLTLRYELYLQVNLITTPLLCVTLSLAALSLFRKFLNFSSTVLEYLSAASYTIYVVHMPVCLWTSYFLVPYQLPLLAKLSISVLSGVLVSLLVHEVIKNAFGMMQGGKLGFTLGNKWILWVQKSTSNPAEVS